jgi:hypothetical protein
VGIAEVKGIGTVDFDFLFARLDGFVRIQPAGPLTVESLEEAATHLPPPAPGASLLRLVESWVAATRKPRASSHGPHISVDLSGEAEYLGKL